MKLTKKEYVAKLKSYADFYYDALVVDEIIMEEIDNSLFPYIKNDNDAVSFINDIISTAGDDSNIRDLFIRFMIYGKLKDPTFLYRLKDLNTDQFQDFFALYGLYDDEKSFLVGIPSHPEYRLTELEESRLNAYMLWTKGNQSLSKKESDSQTLQMQ